MWKNYFKIALRAAYRHKGYTFINVAGLGVGLAGVLLMALYVGHELSVDRFHAGAGRTYRLVQTTGETTSARTAGAHAALLEAQVPGVETTVRLAPWARTITVLGDDDAGPTSFPEPDFLYADPSFFDVFSFPLLQGDPETALSAPGTAVITEATARTYFGDADPMGRTISMYDEYSDPNQIPLTVTGVLADAPGRSHLRLSVLSSTATMARQYGPLDKFGWPSLYTYARLTAQADPQVAARRATAALPDRLLTSEDAPALRLQPLPAVYLDPQEEDEMGAHGSKAMVYGLAGIALAVLLLACVNFTNLAIARVTTRIREVGVRRAVGAYPTQVVAQFLFDAFLQTTLALGVAAWLAWMALPSVSAALGRDLASVAADAGVVLPAALLAVAVLTGLLAGTYPAFVAARQDPTRALHGLVRVPRGAAGTRAGLIVFQFGASIVLVVLTLGITQQLEHVRTLHLGFDEEHVVAIPAGAARRAFEPVREALQAQPGVVAVSAANGVPGIQEAAQQHMTVQREGQTEGGAPIYTQAVAPGFFDVMDIRIVAGRAPTAGAPAERPLVLNETAAAALGWRAEEAVGQVVRVTQPGNEANNPGFTGTVVGIAADFHHGSARMRIPAAAYFPAQSADVPGLYVISHVLVKLAPGTPDGRVADLEDAWKRVLAGHPFEATFLDAQIRAQYEADRRLGHAMTLFTGLAMFVACLGLFGLAAFAAERRRKEIGIRKVLGASVTSVVALLSKDFAKLVGVAFVVAAPVAYLAIQRWLEGFAYRIEPGAWLFVAAGAALLVVTLLTVSTQALRAATANPTEALRQE